MQKIITLAFFLLFSVFSNAQNIRMEGFITDSKTFGLEMANVMAVNQTNNAMDSYAITNDKGKFQLSLKANTSYKIKVSYIGFQGKEIEVKTGTENITQAIILEEGIGLDEVEIVSEMPVSIKGDTIVYNSDSFTNGTERKLGDILKKLPGVEVNKDGQIQVEGKTVQKLMIDGKDFFDGDTKLGVQNIPADAVDKVQVLRNYNEVSQLKGLENNEENIAMNIKLKEGKKNFWFGDITAGIGVGHEEERYIANPKLFYYSPKYSINLLANFNNIGELPFTAQDYFKFTGGFRGIMRKGGTNFNVASNDLGISMARNNRAKEIETQFGAGNFSYNPAKAWTISGFGIITSSDTEMETFTKNSYLNTETGEVETEQTSDEIALQKTNLGLFKLSSSYVPNEKVHFDYDLLLKTSKQDENLGLLTTQTAQGSSVPQDIYTNKKQNPFSINQNLNYYYTVDDKNVLAFEMQHLYQDEDPFYNANLLLQPFNLAGYNATQERNIISQERFVRTNKVDAKLDYYYMVTPKSNINFTLGNTYSYQNFNSHIFQILDNQAQNDLNSAENNNDVNYMFNDVFLGLHYKFITGRFTFNPGVSVHNYFMKNEQLDSDFDRSFFRVLPDVYALYQIKKSETVTYNFTMQNDFTDISQLAEGNVFSSYNSLFRGQRNLENALSQTHSLRYFKFNMFNQTNISGFVNYNKRVDAVKRIASFDGINQTSTPFNSNFADETLSGFFRYGRSFARFYKASVSANLSWSKQNNIQVDRSTQAQIFTATETFTQGYNFSFSTNFKNLPSLEMGYGVTINEYQNDVFYNNSPFANLEYFFLDAFSFKAEYEFNKYSNKSKTVDNQYDFLSASLSYQKKGSKLEYKVGATNLLNTTSLNDDSFNQFFTRTSQYRVQPRYMIFSLRYNL
ncbi:carboxypeptidase-like regulatory domain-containing protein [Flavobacterium macacae]|uniref:TonB-dependent receptor n=1 Tax=Flavobacterium macacae TaxID=2488993 RepID=A0A3P3W8T7_9FLAO|nr:carboxypeptidase-like regulatory domain-containing protein [Flavobacterium macacae]RRJ91114.1 TonB-dependent receptor [Flavobacterium macacae]